MEAHVEHAAPLEACGLLAGKHDTVQRVIPITNQTQSRTRYRMDPREQLAAFEAIESDGLDLIGIFHSHPAGPATPSATDIEEAAYPVVQIIWSKTGGRWQARGFWIEDHSVNEVVLQIEVPG